VTLLSISFSRVLYPGIDLKSGEARTNITSKGDTQLRTSDVQHAVHVVWNTFFSGERVCNLADICVCHLMTISLEYIEEWAADSEGYYLTEDHRTAEDNVSMAAQILYCSLVESSVARRVVLPRLVALLSDRDSQMNACRQEIASKPLESGDFNCVHPSVILWDALYTATGLSASALDDCDGWNFQRWYSETLGPCLSLLLSSKGSVSFEPHV